MAFNLDGMVSIMKKGGLLQRILVTTKPDVNMALAKLINLAEKAVSSIPRGADIS